MSRSEKTSSGPKGKRGPGGGRLLVNMAKIAILAVLAYFWYRYIMNNREALLGWDWRIGWGSGVLSAFFIMAGYLIRSCLWAPMRYELTGERMSMAESFRVSSISWMGRYVPGKIWTVAGKACLSAKDTTRIPALGIAVIVEILWFQLAGVMIAVLMLASTGGRLFSPGIRIAMLAILATGLPACHPRVFISASNKILGFFRKPLLAHRPRYRAMLIIMMANAATFVLWGMSLLILARGVSSVGFSELPYITGVFSAAWVIGFFMILVPAGIGVRESILMLGLRHVGLADPAIIKLVLASRVLMTLAEFAFFLVAAFMTFKGGKPVDAGCADNDLDSRGPMMIK